MGFYDSLDRVTRPHPLHFVTHTPRAARSRQADACVSGMQQYRHLVGQILSRGKTRPQRATLSDGTRPAMRAIFGAQLHLNLEEGFPLVTVKRTPFRLITEELLWILSGSTNVRPLQAKGVHIWDEWADAETGELGPVYGKQWRRWERSDGTTVDQVARLVENLHALRRDPEHPSGRRLVVSAWNPGDTAWGTTRAPTACHTLCQLDVAGERLSCSMYQRSADVFLGLPFNIASYALLTHMLAHVAGLGVGELVVSIGNAHLYENHIPQASAIVGRDRQPYPSPTLTITREHASIDDFTSASFRLEGYQAHPALPGDVAI